MIDGGTATIFGIVGGQVLVLVATVAVLKYQMQDIRADVRELKTVVVELANVKGEMLMMQERSVATGKRVDDLTSLVMSHLIGRPMAENINKVKGVSG